MNFDRFTFKQLNREEYPDQNTKFVTSSIPDFFDDTQSFMSTENTSTMIETCDFGDSELVDKLCNAVQLNHTDNSYPYIPNQPNFALDNAVNDLTRSVNDMMISPEPYQGQNVLEKMSLGSDYSKSLCKDVG